MAVDPRGGGKPRVIVLGGCGFIGRNLVHFFIENDLVSAVRIVDKVPPQTAWLNPKHQATFDHPKVEFRSANLINPASVIGAYTTDDGACWDIVVNCACETKSGQVEAVLREGVYKLSLLCAAEAAKQNVKRYIEISTGHMFSSEKVAHKEDGKLEPWTLVGKLKSQVEMELKRIDGLRYTVIRPGIVYGLGDRNGLVPRLVIGAVYTHLGEMMKMLWTKDLLMNTVHVDDVCRAVWHLAFLDDSLGQVYNLVDDSNTTQGLISSLVSDLFNINHDYWGATLSSVCKVDMESVVGQVNDKHMGPWAEACARSGVENTPLTPYLDAEHLLNKHVHLDGSKLRATGFTYSVPLLTGGKLKEILEDYVAMNLFPKYLVS